MIVSPNGEICQPEYHRAPNLAHGYFAIMINDLRQPQIDQTMFVDDLTILEIVPKCNPSIIQESVHSIQLWSDTNLFP